MPEPTKERVDWGELLEPAIAAGVTREMRWDLRKFERYASHDTVEGWGCSIDFHCGAQARAARRTRIAMTATTEDLRAAALALNRNTRHGALANLARLTGTRYRTMQSYAAKHRPVPRWLEVSIRNLLAIQAMIKGDAT